ncbi:unnamed protein product [Ectocarpus sp. CCAP 1310/34]|nr:unnamed protein product [Ectocarpus sp. CCAP 1310/34]
MHTITSRTHTAGRSFVTNERAAEAANVSFFRCVSCVSHLVSEAFIHSSPRSFVPTACLMLFRPSESSTAGGGSAPARRQNVRFRGQGNAHVYLCARVWPNSPATFG